MGNKKKSLFIGCGMIKKELENALEACDKEYDVIWMNSFLHTYPNKLKVELQKTIDESDGYDDIYLAFGLCGNAIEGIKATTADIIFPHVSDCIHAFLYDCPYLDSLRTCSYFISEGWLTVEGNLMEQYDMMLDKYGKENTARLMRLLYQNYRDMVYMKTEDVISADIMKIADDYAKLTGLELKTENASIGFYVRFLNDVDNEISVRVKKGDCVNFDYCV